MNAITTCLLARLLFCLCICLFVCLLVMLFVCSFVCMLLDYLSLLLIVHQIQGLAASAAAFAFAASASSAALAFSASSINCLYVNTTVSPEVVKFMAPAIFSYISADLRLVSATNSQTFLSIESEIKHVRMMTMIIMK